MLAREKYLEAHFFFDRVVKQTEDAEPLKYNLSAFLQALRSVTDYLRAEFKYDPKFNSWFGRKWAEVQQDAVLSLLHKHRNLTVHVRNPRVVGKFKVYLRDPMVEMPEAVKALLHAPDGYEVDVIGPPDLPPDFAESTHVAKVEKLFFFDGYENKDLLALCFEGLLKLDKLLSEWEEISQGNVQEASVPSSQGEVPGGNSSQG